MERVDKMLRERSPADDRAGLELILDQIDEIVAAGLGLDETELEEIQRLCREDGFLKAIQPRYPFAEVRRQGFRKNLEKSTRYQ